MRKQKTRSNLIKKCDAQMFKILLVERGAICELCGGRANLGTFHILSKKKYPRIRYHKKNLLIAGWFCCHFPFHQDYYMARDKIIPRIKELRGENYEDELKALDAISEKLSLTRLNIL